MRLQGASPLYPRMEMVIQTNLWYTIEISAIIAIDIFYLATWNLATWNLYKYYLAL